MKVLAILIPPALLLFTLWLRRRRWGRKLKEPRCGKCGTIVKQLAAMKCPQCGADLRQVGIARRAPMRWLGRRVLLTLWTLALPLPAILLSVLFHRVAVPVPHARTAEYRFNLPRSQQYQAMELVITGRDLRWFWQTSEALPVTEVDVTLVLKSGERSALRVDGRTLTVVREGEVEPTPFQQAAVIEWMKASGIDTLMPQVRDEAGEIVAAVKSVAGTERYLVTMVSYESAQTLRWSSVREDTGLTWVYVGFWAMVWLSGAAYLWRTTEAM